MRVERVRRVRKVPTHRCFTTRKGADSGRDGKPVRLDLSDEPRAAVEQADALVAEVIKRLAEVFADERTTLEQQWGRGDNVSTRICASR